MRSYAALRTNPYVLIIAHSKYVGFINFISIYDIIIIAFITIGYNFSLVHMTILFTLLYYAVISSERNSLNLLRM